MATITKPEELQAARLSWLRRHPMLVAALGLLAALGIYGAAVAFALMGARDAIQEGRDALQPALAAAGALALDEAEQHLGRAQERFAIADQRLHSRMLGPLAAMPLVGDNVAAVRAAVDVSAELLTALLALVGTVSQAPDGLGEFLPADGRFPVERYVDLAEPMAVLHDSLASGLVRLDAAVDGELAPSVEAAVLELRERIIDAERTTAAADAALRSLPSLLGADGPRHYFFAAGNPAELRGAGGFLGAYAILTVENGHLEFGEFDSITALTSLATHDIEAPNPDFAARYDQYGGAVYWQNINMTPDFPSAGSAILALYEHTEGRRLDGVITADPAALGALAEVTGPVELPGIGVVAAADLVSVLANESVEAFADSTTRKQVLGAAAAGVFQGFLQRGGDPAATIAALADIAGGRHLLVYADDPDVQALLEHAGVDGGLYRGDADYVTVSGVNGAGNKADFYMDRTITYDATLEADGRVRATAGIRLDNHAPTEGEPAWVIGPNYFDFVAGENATILSVFCGSCAIHRFQRDGVPTPVRAEEELGHRVFWSYERLRSGEAVELTYDWALQRGWRQGRHLARYQLVVDGQTTIRPTTLRLRITPPPGMAVVSTTPRLHRDGDAYSWEGELRGRRTVEVLFRPAGNPVRAAFSRWWNRPLVGG